MPFARLPQRSRTWRGSAPGNALVGWPAYPLAPMVGAPVWFGQRACSGLVPSGLGNGKPPGSARGLGLSVYPSGRLPERRHIVTAGHRLALAIGRPVRHQARPALQQITAPIGGLDLVPDHMGKGHFKNLV